MRKSNLYNPSVSRPLDTSLYTREALGECEQRLYPYRVWFVAGCFTCGVCHGSSRRRPLPHLVCCRLFWLRRFIFKRFNTPPTVVILERSEGSRWGTDVDVERTHETPPTSGEVSSERETERALEQIISCPILFYMSCSHIRRASLV